MTRGRRKDLSLQPSRALMQQRDYRARKAQYVADLEERCRQAEEENAHLRRELEDLKVSMRHGLAAAASYSPEVASASDELLHHLSLATSSLAKFQRVAFDKPPPLHELQSRTSLPLDPSVGSLYPGPPGPSAPSLPGLPSTSNIFRSPPHNLPPSSPIPVQRRDSQSPEFPHSTTHRHSSPSKGGAPPLPSHPSDYSITSMTGHVSGPSSATEPSSQSLLSLSRPSSHVLPLHAHTQTYTPTPTLPVTAGPSGIHSGSNNATQRASIPDRHSLTLPPLQLHHHSHPSTGSPGLPMSSSRPGYSIDSTSKPSPPPNIWGERSSGNGGAAVGSSVLGTTEADDQMEDETPHQFLVDENGEERDETHTFTMEDDGDPGRVAGPSHSRSHRSRTSERQDSRASSLHSGFGSSDAGHRHENFHSSGEHS